MKKFVINLSAVAAILLTPTVSFAQVVINEIMYDPEGTDANAGGEWIEVKIIANGINLSNWKIADKTGTSGSFTNRSIRHEGGADILSTGDYAIIAKNKDDFISFFPSYSGPLFSSPISLTDEDQIKLLNENSTEIDNVSFSSNIGAKGDGNSLQKTSSGWVAASPTPGYENSSGSSGEVLAANTSDSGGSSALSATSGAAEPMYSAASSKLEVSAGSDRLTSPGSPIAFQAQIKKNSSAGASVKFSWSFGDGNVGSGTLVSHIYKYPGEYAVVLNAVSGDTFAASRFKVKVVEVDISVTGENEYIEIKNNTGYEINLFNWKIVDSHKGFVFQPDTIIFPKSKIRIDRSLLKMKGEAEENLVLKNYLDQVVASAPKRPESADLKEVSGEFEKIRTQAYAVVNKAASLGLVRENAPAAPILTNLADASEEENQEPTDNEENLIYIAPKRGGWGGRFWGLLTDLFK